MSQDSTWSRVARFLYTQNPFYFISAALILYGLRGAFHSHTEAVDSPWPVAAALAGYTLLMAAVGFAIVKFGKVWDDARSVLLIILFLFTALSISFDPLCHSHPRLAAQVLASGWFFSIAVTETLLRSLSIRLPIRLRGPYYLILALFFFYPLWACGWIGSGVGPSPAWRVFLFPVVAGAIFLTLTPAIRLGPDYTAKNGTPWRWPLYPWSIYTYLAVAVMIRSYVLSLSFDSAPGMQTAFGLYFLTPFVLALFVLLAEMAASENVQPLDGLRRFVLGAAPLVLLMSVPIGQSDVFHGFLTELSRTVGSPLWLTAWGLVAFYAWCRLRGLTGARAGLCLALVIVSLIGPRSLGPDSLVFPLWPPLAILTILQLVQAIRRPSPAQWLGATLAFAAATASPMFHWRPDIAIGWSAHLVLIGALAIGGYWSDEFAKAMRIVAAWLAAALTLACFISWIVATRGEAGGVPANFLLRMAYLAALAFIMTVYAYRFRDLACLKSAGAAAAGLMATGALQSFRAAPGALSIGAAIPIAAGTACFVAAVIISAFKAGWLTGAKQILTHCRGRFRES